MATSDLLATQQQTAVAYPQGLPVSSPWPEEMDSGDGIRLSSLLHSLRRQWLLALGIGFMAATFISFLLWLLIPVEFEAESVLRISREAETVGRTSRYRTIADYMTYKETQATLLKSTFVINAALRPDPDPRKDISQLRVVRFEKWLGILDRKRERPVAWLEDEIRVDLAGDSELLRVRLRGKDREETMQVLDAVVGAFLSEIVNTERMRKIKMLDNLKRRYRHNYSQVQEKSDAVSSIAEQLGTLDSETILSQQRILLQELQSTKRELDFLRRLLNEAIGELNLMQINVQFGTHAPSEHAIQDELEKDAEFLSLRYQISQIQDALDMRTGLVRSGSPALNQLQQEIALVQRKQDNLREVLTPRVIERLKNAEGESDIDRQKAMLLQRATAQNLANQVQQMDQAYAASLELYRELGGTSGDLEARMNELQALREDTHDLHSDIQELEIQIEQPERIQIVQEATIPDDSNWKLILAELVSAWLLTLGLVIGGVAYWDYLGKRVNNSEDLTRASNVHVVGTLPAIQQTGLLTFLRLGREQLEQAMNVSIDGIRTALLYNRHATQVVMVTSATGQEGRSTVASQLAVSMARAGKRTLLVDGDLRNPQQHLVFGVEARAGLCEMLRGETTAEQAILPTAAENVWLLAAGRCDQTALQGLAGEQATAIFQNLRERFDVIILDSSPVLTSADALLLGQYADTTLISVRRDVSQLPKINAASDRLSSVGIHVLGAVVNGTDVEVRRGELAGAEVNVDQPALTDA